MKTSTSLLLAGLLFGAACTDASATNYSGKFDIAQSDNMGSPTTIRYYNMASALSIYAPANSNADILREAFFKKTYISISYTPIVCPGGVTGTCGTLVSISVNASNIP
jgi:hypothetical protein